MVARGVSRQSQAWHRAWMLGWATSAVARVKATEAQATDETEDGPELLNVLSERTTLVRLRADNAYPHARETRQRYTAVSGYDVGYTDSHEADI